MKLIKHIRGSAQATRIALEQRGALTSERVEKAASRIVTAVRAAEMLPCAATPDARFIGQESPLRVSAEEMEAAWENGPRFQTR